MPDTLSAPAESTAETGVPVAVPVATPSVLDETPAPGTPAGADPLEEIVPAGTIKFPAADIEQVLEIYAMFVERTILRPANLPAGFISPGPGPWEGQIFQPIVDPPEGVRHWADFLMDAWERMGLLPEVNNLINDKSGLVAAGKNALEPDKKYTTEDIAKRTVCMMTGDEAFNPEIFTDTGRVPFYEKTPEEAYPACFWKARVPIYFEHFIEVGKDFCAAVAFGPKNLHLGIGDI